MNASQSSSVKDGFSSLEYHKKGSYGSTSKTFENKDTGRTHKSPPRISPSRPHKSRSDETLHGSSALHHGNGYSRSIIETHSPRESQSDEKLSTFFDGELNYEKKDPHFVVATVPKKSDLDDMNCERIEGCTNRLDPNLNSCLTLSRGGLLRAYPTLGTAERKMRLNKGPAPTFLNVICMERIPFLLILMRDAIEKYEQSQPSSNRGKFNKILMECLPEATVTFLQSGLKKNQDSDLSLLKTLSDRGLKKLLKDVPALNNTFLLNFVERLEKEGVSLHALGHFIEAMHGPHWQRYFITENPTEPPSRNPLSLYAAGGWKWSKRVAYGIWNIATDLGAALLVQAGPLFFYYTLQGSIALMFRSFRHQLPHLVTTTGLLGAHTSSIAQTLTNLNHWWHNLLNSGTTDWMTYHVAIMLSMTFLDVVCRWTLYVMTTIARCVKMLFTEVVGNETMRKLRKSPLVSCITEIFFWFCAKLPQKLEAERKYPLPTVFKQWIAVYTLSKVDSFGDSLWDTSQVDPAISNSINKHTAEWTVKATPEQFKDVIREMESRQKLLRDLKSNDDIYAALQEHNCISALSKPEQFRHFGLEMGVLSHGAAVDYNSNKSFATDNSFWSSVLDNAHECLDQQIIAMKAYAENLDVGSGTRTTTTKVLQAIASARAIADKETNWLKRTSLISGQAASALKTAALYDKYRNSPDLKFAPSFVSSGLKPLIAYMHSTMSDCVSIIQTAPEKISKNIRNTWSGRHHVTDSLTVNPWPLHFQIVDNFVRFLLQSAVFTLPYLGDIAMGLTPSASTFMLAYLSWDFITLTIPAFKNSFVATNKLTREQASGQVMNKRFLSVNPEKAYHEYIQKAMEVLRNELRTLDRWVDQTAKVKNSDIAAAYSHVASSLADVQAQTTETLLLGRSITDKTIGRLTTKLENTNQEMNDLFHVLEEESQASSDTDDHDIYLDRLNDIEELIEAQTGIENALIQAKAELKKKIQVELSDKLHEKRKVLE